MNEDDFRKLAEAGFTATELRAIATDVSFAAMVAEETGRGAFVADDAAVEWTPEKRAAFTEFVRKGREGS